MIEALLSIIEGLLVLLQLVAPVAKEYDSNPFSNGNWDFDSMGFVNQYGLNRKVNTYHRGKA